MDIMDANRVSIGSRECDGLTDEFSCSVEAPITSPASGGPTSPFTCFIQAVFETNIGGLERPVRGSICGIAANPINGLPAIGYCLQALLRNFQSGGWGPP
jgi:hypothetical protein